MTATTTDTHPVPSLEEILGAYGLTRGQIDDLFDDLDILINEEASEEAADILKPFGIRVGHLLHKASTAAENAGGPIVRNLHQDYVDEFKALLTMIRASGRT